MPSGPTHRGSPFAGRRRELGLLRRLVGEGLHHAPHHIRVAGEPGSGRRRLIREAVRRGPDAEWIELAPGGVHADLSRWVRSEFRDLLDSYPDAPVPSWCFHVLSALDPALRRRASLPALGDESLAAEPWWPRLVGAATGTAILAFTSRTPVVIDAGLWPRHDAALQDSLHALAEATAAPGAVLLSAHDADDPELGRHPEIHTMTLRPLDRGAVDALIEAWAAPREWAAWLHRVSRGHAFTLHEIVRWLEELGHVHVDDDTQTVRLLHPVNRLPIPMSRDAVLENRFRRLTPGAQYLLDLIRGADGLQETRDLHDRWEGEDEEFEEALSVLRRRAFLLDRSSLHPVAMASPLWQGPVQPPSRRRFRRRRRARATLEPLRTPRVPTAPLARILREVNERLADPSGLEVEAVAALWRSARARHGTAWDGARGRIALAAGLLRFRQGRRDRAVAWAARGRALLAPEPHPSLRRSLALLAIRARELGGDGAGAHALRETIYQEALLAGHLVTAARIQGALAESSRRRGRWSEVHRHGAAAESMLRTMGLSEIADSVNQVRVAALLQTRRYDDALAATASPDLAALAQERRDGAEFVEAFYSRPLVSGLGFGLDDAARYRTARARLVELTARSRTGETERVSTNLLAELDDAGYAGLAVELRRLRGEEPAPRPALVVASAGEQGPKIVLRLLGRAVLERRGALCPLPLWPEWWRRLAGAVVAAAVQGETLSWDAADRAVADADPPAGSWPDRLAAANAFLWGGAAGAGGFAARPDGIRWDERGVGVDALRVLELLHTADTHDAAGAWADAAAVRTEAAAWITGPFLPGSESASIRAARDRIAARVHEALRARLQPGAAFAGEDYAVWMEGAARCMEPDTIRARHLRARGWPPPAPAGPASP